MSRLRREIFSPVDAAWLRMDSPTNMAMITGVMMFDEPLDLARLKAVITDRLLRYPRFRQRVREPLLPLGLPRWEPDPHFDLAAHLHRIALPPPGDVYALQELVGDFMGTPLDFTKPLWQLHVVEGFGKGCALIARLHHCIADGLALVQVLLSLTDPQADTPPSGPVAEPEGGGGLFEALLTPALTALDTAWRATAFTQDLLRDGRAMLTDPARLAAAAQTGAAGVGALSKLLLIPPDRRTILRGRCGVPKRAVWTAPVPLAQVKAIGHARGCTVNDLLLAAVSGALRRYLEGRGQPTEGLNIRAMVPVSLRPPEELDQLGNRFGLVILSLPVGERDPEQRLRVLKQRMDAIKSTPEAAVAFGILTVMGLTPVQIEKIIVDIFAAKVTAVMTNVPGPTQTLYLVGSPIRDLMFWVPSPGGLALGISILSYAGRVMVGVATDKGLIPDPEAIVAGFHAELAELGGVVPSEPVAVVVSGGEPRRCAALTRTGQPCKNPVAPGETLCRVHRSAGP